MFVFVARRSNHKAWSCLFILVLCYSVFSPPGVQCTLYTLAVHTQNVDYERSLTPQGEGWGRDLPGSALIHHSILTAMSLSEFLGSGENTHRRSKKFLRG